MRAGLNLKGGCIVQKKDMSLAISGEESDDIVASEDSFSRTLVPKNLNA